MTKQRTFIGSHEELMDCICDIQVSRTLSAVSQRRRERKEKQKQNFKAREILNAGRNVS